MLAGFLAYKMGKYVHFQASYAKVKMLEPFQEIWNQLPVSVRYSTSVSSFKSSLKTVLF